MINKYLLNCFTALALISYMGFSSAQDDDGEVEELSLPVPNLTQQPLVRVIANPEKFHNKEITVTGYYMKGTHINHLYLEPYS